MNRRNPAKTMRVRSQNWPIQDLPGLDGAAQALLLSQGIDTTLKLWQQTTTASQRAQLASDLQIHLQYVNKWAALANLSRLPSVGYQYCGLLLHAGIASPTQLTQMSLAQVHQQILRLQVAELHRKDLCPSLETVRN